MILNERLDDACVAELARELSAPEPDGLLVIEGRAERFCLGMDFATMSQPDAGERRRRLTGFADVVRRLLTVPVPTLAVIDGPALGGGLGIAAACDYVLASDRARVGLPEALYGLAPAIIRPVLLTRLSQQQLRMLIATCHSRDASEAKALGLVDEVVPVAELDLAKARVLRQLRRASRATMAVVRRWDADALATQIERGLVETTAALDLAEVRTAITAGVWS